MKKQVLITAVTVASVVAASTVFAGSLTFKGTNVAKAGVVASKHNMNLYQENTKDTEGRVCSFCHTPHHALADNTGGIADYLPLWSHVITNQVNYNSYFTPTVKVGGDKSLNGVTILCMSCHDGVIAVDEHYNNGLTTNKLDYDGFGGTAIGLKNADGRGSLQNDHPIGFLYSDALAAHTGDLADASTTFKGGNKTIADQLTDGFFTCATCHDVHNKDNVKNTAPTAVGNYFLLGDNNNSDFCTTCHLK